jgi:hypothetical protein
MRNEETNIASEEAGALALRALAWTLDDEARAARLLALTGLTPDDLRAGLGETTLLAALLRFLEGHEPDLTACAEALGTRPERIVAARRRLDA